MSDEPGLAARVASSPALAGRPPARLLVALSGGMDSTVLLHLLRELVATGGALAGVELHAAHLDHAMRPGSAPDAERVRQLCEGWGVPLTIARLDETPGDEAEARTARLDFLERTADEVGAGWIVTGHHAGDQAETVLFRAVRGTGVRGLAGIPAVRGRWRRPLLQIEPESLRDHALAHGLSWIEDPANHGRGNARARMRREILPRLATEIAPDAIRALARLADHARGVDDEIAALTEALAEAIGVQIGEGRADLPEGTLDPAADPGVRARLLRYACAAVGRTLDAATTARLLAEAPALGRGKRLDAGGGAVLHRTAGGWRLEASLVEPTAADLAVDPHTPGTATLELAGRGLRVRWGPERPADSAGLVGEAHLAAEAVTLPLHVRGWRPGDRVRLPHGSRTVARLLSEARIPVPDRPRTPVVTDARGTLVWIPDLDVTTVPSSDETGSIWMGIGDADG